VCGALRLWPTTPLLLRETTAETAWENGTIPANTAILIFTPFFHRDNERLSYADRFAPELWLSEHAEASAPLIPFSEGPAVCPGRELVLFLSSAMIAAILRDSRVRLAEPAKLAADRQLPATLNHFGLRFHVQRYWE
jgi:cytochrome P450